MPFRTERFYANYLREYVNKYYGVYEESIEWFPNPSLNQWKIRIPELELDILLTCYDDGEVIEKRKRVNTH